MAKKRSHAGRHGKPDPTRFRNKVEHRLKNKSYADAVTTMTHKFHPAEEEGRGDAQGILDAVLGGNRTEREEIELTNQCHDLEDLIETTIVSNKLGLRTGRTLNTAIKDLGNRYGKLIEVSHRLLEEYDTAEQKDLAEYMEKTKDPAAVGKKMAKEYVALVRSIVDEVAREFGIGEQGQER